MKRLFVLLILLVGMSGMLSAQKKNVGQVKTVVIDAGHGGAKPGAVGALSKEKNITLSIALKLGKLIETNYPDVKVIYTRTTDVDVALSERAHIANRAKADLFLSIHCNSWNSSNPTGMETYVMGLSQSKANLEVAKKENADILLEEGYRSNNDYQGFDPNSPESYVMFAMYQNAYLDKSLDFAGFIQKQYNKNIKSLNRGVKQAEIFVLYKTAMPSILTEVGFISNPEEERYMMSDAGQATIVNCIYNAFSQYKLAQDGTPIPSVKKAADPATVATVALAEEKPATPAPQADPTTFVPSTAQTGVEPPLPLDEPKESLPLVPESAVKAAPQQSDATSQGVIDYRVQFLVSGKELKADAREFKGLTEYEYYMRDGKYCYVTGHCTTVRAASRLQKEVQARGFKDAFPVAFLNGERISLQRAKELSNNQ